MSQLPVSDDMMVQRGDRRSSIKQEYEGQMKEI
jgi:hypothetical protein